MLNKCSSICEKSRNKSYGIVQCRQCTPKRFEQATNLYLGIASTRETVAGRVVMDSLARHIKTQATHTTTNQNDAHIHNSECDLARRREPLAFVDMQPVHTAQSVTEPTSEQRADQTEQVTEDGNSIGDDPGNHPASETNGDPGSNGNQITLMHAVSSTEQTDVDVLETNVAVDDTSTDNLWKCQQPNLEVAEWERRRTVGMAIP